MKLDRVPEELKGIRQWSISYSADQLKRPRHTKYEPNGAFTAVEAEHNSQGVLLTGFYVTANDPYILIDIDHVENPISPWDELPHNLRSMMQAIPSYWEASPSGHGLRGVLKLPSADIKKDLKTSRALLIGADGKPSTEAEIHFGAPWMTITGAKMPYATNNVATINIEDLSDIFKIVFKSEEVAEIAPIPDDLANLPSIQDIEVALNGIPLNQNPRIKRAFRKILGYDYQHYDFWMKIMMAVHQYSVITNTGMQCLDIFDTWSKHDEENYKGTDDILTHWKSLANNDSNVTFKTLFRFYIEVTLIWPIPKKQTKDQKITGVPPLPQPNAYENFIAIVNHYNLKFFHDALRKSNLMDVYITGDKDIMDEYLTGHSMDIEYNIYYGQFSRELIVPIFATLLEKHGFIGIRHMVVKEFLERYLSGIHIPKVNFIKEYIETPINSLPLKYTENVENELTSNFLALFECMKIECISNHPEQEMKLYRKYYFAWFMNFIRNMYGNINEPNINNCVLVLTGREQIRKTSHFKFLFPTFMRKYIVFTPHGFANSDSMRDLAKISSSNLVVVWDEVEQFLNPQTESNFKKIIDNNPQTIIDKYETKEKLIVPLSIYGATSNQREFKLGDTGSRRMFIIPVKWVDTDKMMKLCWHPIFHELLEFYDYAIKHNKQPWLLTEEELQFQSALHDRVKSKTDFDMILEEIFDTNVPVEYITVDGNTSIKGITRIQGDTSGRLLSTKDIQSLIRRYDPEIGKIKRPVLVHALKRFCGAYTKTENKRKVIYRPHCTITAGFVEQNVHKKWLVPPLSGELKSSAFTS